MAANVAGLLAIGRPSFLQDVMRGRRTEIEELNGYVVAEGKRLGVPTPFNEAVVREVKKHAVGRSSRPEEPGPDRRAAARRAADPGLTGPVHHVVSSQRQYWSTR